MWSGEEMRGVVKLHAGAPGPNMEQIELIGCGLAPEQQSLEINAIAVRRPALLSGPDGLLNLSWNH